MPQSAQTPARDVPIRDAATVIALRARKGQREVLMGQRGAKAAFMPMKFVFPGGAVDPEDAEVPLAAPLPQPCARRLAEDARPELVPALAAAAIRELWEETGLVLGRPGAWPDAPADWQGFAATGHRPDPSALRFVFRAVTPPGRPRRFDARFFTLDADAAIRGDLEDFSAACDELSHLQWIPLPEVRAFDLPFITEVVLAEIAASETGEAPASVPYFAQDEEEQLFRRLGGRSPLVS
ncbi:8-oxo-dGTP pyrophosphatase MutT, NUDIX family [Pseudooceanicola antarcticus]|uniref:8-oxo-dGTP pyrophosphatase MutT, NUDIX family n=1 Tax=Pseudooceanicola antarcticus TaxID=1247613 RepID=A0A285JA68_9RHOB|nr:NUDIX hydrolase [Pseudooceanicola antarcticus]PJE30801.1 NUDIX hydrolase [Pseudooceanicola antarcticus]SNY57112.1 8-oxo-dGTP pyrophosphatase MutT, NUDIX family [Pseudooceanicola antarcticus]